jgi:polysaccharide pyruvyl transferase WcaK-like protein
LEDSYAIRLTRKMVKKLTQWDDCLDPRRRSMTQIYEEQYRLNPSFRSVVKEIDRADFVFDMGHGALNDVFDPFALCFLYYLADRLGKPLFVSGQSVGPFWRRRSIEMVLETLCAAHTVGLRDRKVSYDVLVNEVGIDPNRVRLVEVGDDSLDLDSAEPDFEQSSPVVASLLQNESFFSVQWRTSNYTSRMRLTAELLPLVQAIEQISKLTGLPAVFVPLSWELESSDVLVGARLEALLQPEVPFYVAWNYQDPEVVKWILGRARFGVGMSYHFHVLSLCQGVPTIGFYSNEYYDIKLRGAFSAFDHRMTPMRFPDGLKSGPTLYEAIHVVLDWSLQDRQRLISSASRDRILWHRVFQKFMLDCGLTR